MKRCHICKTIKDKHFFYKDRSRKDGLDNKCKVCTASYKRKRRLSNLSYYRSRDKKYNYLNKEKRNIYNRAWKAKNKHKINAHYLVRMAVREGLLIKMVCKKCSNPNTEAHHPDYNKPLQVIWLCRFHHRLEKHF
jgi:hypothetical protein